MEHFLVGRFDGKQVVASLGLAQLVQVDALFDDEG